MISTMKKPMKKKPQTDPQKSSPEANSQLPTPISTPDFTEETALAFFARYLDGLKWKFRCIEDRPILFCGFNGEQVQWDFNMTVREMSPGLFQLGVNSFLPNKVLPPRRPAAMELLTRINFELAIGCFEMNLAEGEIRCRTSVLIPAADITQGIVEHLVRSNIYIVEERYPQIMAVLYSGTSPEDSIKISASDQHPASSIQQPPGSEPRFDFN